MTPKLFSETDKEKQTLKKTSLCNCRFDVPPIIPHRYEKDSFLFFPFFLTFQNPPTFNIRDKSGDLSDKGQGAEAE